MIVKKGWLEHCQTKEQVGAKIGKNANSTMYKWKDASMSPDAQGL